MRDFVLVASVVAVGLVADLLFVRYVVRHTDMVEVLTRMQAGRGGRVPEAGSDEAIRWAQAKMLNGGYPASEVTFEPANSAL